MLNLGNRDGSIKNICKHTGNLTLYTPKCMLFLIIGVTCALRSCTYSSFYIFYDIIAICCIFVDSLLTA